MPGEYIITYTAIDSSGNETIKTSIIIVRDAKAPIITIIGNNPYNMYFGETYTELGATAIDDVDGDVTDNIIMVSTVSNIPGEYTVTYKVKDSSNNEATAVRTVIVSPSIFNYNYTGAFQTFVVPYNGKYKIELWGAQGGIELAYQTLASKGSYTSGNISLSFGQQLFTYVGEAGKPGIFGINSPATVGKGGIATFNGGGAGGNAGGSTTYPYANYRGGFSGGGATDVRITSGVWNNVTSLISRIMVAGGGGGAQGSIDLGLYDSENSFGGGITGTKGGVDGYIIGRTGMYSSDINRRGIAPTQTSGNAFGIGGTGANTGAHSGPSYCHGHSGGGGGYYGGFGAQATGNNCHIMGGAGGTSFISGHAGVNAINASGAHTNQPNHYSGMVFTNTTILAGSQTMPSPSGGTMVGNIGNGYAKITYLGT